MVGLFVLFSFDFGMACMLGIWILLVLFFLFSLGFEIPSEVLAWAELFFFFSSLLLSFMAVVVSLEYL